MEFTFRDKEIIKSIAQEHNANITTIERLYAELLNKLDSENRVKALVAKITKNNM